MDLLIVGCFFCIRLTIILIKRGILELSPPRNPVGVAVKPPLLRI